MSPVYRALSVDPQFDLKIAVTGSHLSERHGKTISEIAEAGFNVAYRVPTLQDEDGFRGVTQSIARGVIGFAEILGSEPPDLLMLCGDRFELLGPAQAALAARVPVAHFGGGDVTEGALDESIRHCLTKLSSFHFVTHDEAARRVRQLGEDPARVFTVGNPGIDALLAVPEMSRSEIEAQLTVPLARRNYLVTFHPETWSDVAPQEQAMVMIRALEALDPSIGLIVTGANADPGGHEINASMREFCERRPGSVYRDSLGSRLKVNLLRIVDLVIGNSSSGLHEAPSFGKVTVNVGNRQKGRTRGSSVIDSPLDVEAILRAIDSAEAFGSEEITNPYGDGRTAPKVVSLLKSLDLRFQPKRFFDLPAAEI